jgi:hypothetical protein
MYLVKIPVQEVKRQAIISICYGVIETEGIIALVKVGPYVLTRIENPGAIVVQEFFSKTGIDQKIRFIS